MSSGKNNILKRIRMALAQPTPLPFPEAEKPVSLYQPKPEDLLLHFAEQFTALQGKFAYCADNTELQQNLLELLHQRGWKKVFVQFDSLRNMVPQELWHDDIATCDVAITGCEALVARTGSMVLSAVGQGRIPSVYTPVHLCIAHTGQVVYDIADALKKMEAKYGSNLPSMISFATGPSRTADIEKTLVVGVHGPGEVYCLVVESQQA